MELSCESSLHHVHQIHSWTSTSAGRCPMMLVWILLHKAITCNWTCLKVGSRNFSIIEQLPVWGNERYALITIIQMCLQEEGYSPQVKQMLGQEIISLYYTSIGCLKLLKLIAPANGSKFQALAELAPLVWRDHMVWATLHVILAIYNHFIDRTLSHSFLSVNSVLRDFSLFSHYKHTFDTCNQACNYTCPFIDRWLASETNCASN